MTALAYKVLGFLFLLLVLFATSNGKKRKSLRDEVLRNRYQEFESSRIRFFSDSSLKRVREKRKDLTILLLVGNGWDGHFKNFRRPWSNEDTGNPWKDLSIRISHPGVIVGYLEGSSLKYHAELGEGSYAIYALKGDRHVKLDTLRNRDIEFYHLFSDVINSQSNPIQLDQIEVIARQCSSSPENFVSWNGYLGWFGEVWDITMSWSSTKDDVSIDLESFVESTNSPNSSEVENSDLPEFWKDFLERNVETFVEAILFAAFVVWFDIYGIMIIQKLRDDRRGNSKLATLDEINQPSQKRQNPCDRVENEDTNPSTTSVATETAIL